MYPRNILSIALIERDVAEPSQSSRETVVPVKTMFLTAEGKHLSVFDVMPLMLAYLSGGWGVPTTYCSLVF